MKQVHIFISGKVQGVFFRSLAKEEAEKLSLKGWVRNRRDGRVECVVQGEDSKVRQFLAWCREGPRWARVENIEVKDEDIVENLEGFKVLETI